MRRPDLRRPDLLWRAVPVVAGVVAALVEAPQLLVGAIVLLALVVVAERLAARRGRGPLDALLGVVGGVVVTLVLVGLLIGASPVGLSPRTWSVGLAVTSLVGLLVAWFSPRPTHAPGTAHPVADAVRVLPWIAASLVVVTVAISTSAQSIPSTEVSPVQMAFGPVTGTQVQVTVSAQERTGPLELRASVGATEISYPLFTVEPGTTHTTTVSLPSSGRYVITLNYPDQTQPLRSLTLDR